MIITTTFITLVLCLYFYLKSNYNYWEKRGVPNPPPSIIFGNVGDSLILKRSLGQIYKDIYNAFPDLLYVGFYKIRKPGLILRDPQLIKTVLLKEFNSFHDNDIATDEVSDPVLDKNPFTLKGEKWKSVRNEMSPVFTSKKMKSMYPLLEEAGKKMVIYLNKTISGTSTTGIEAKELAAKFGTEVVAISAFGLESNSFDEADSEFRKMGRKIFEPTTFTVIKILIITILPSLGQYLKIKFFPEEVSTYFKNILNMTLRYRKENNIVRDDFLDHVLSLKAKSKDNEMTDTDVVSHALSFLIDGFETTSSVVSYALYQLAVNPEVQENLRTEIEDTYTKNQNRIDYETLNDMPLLDAVISETLRMHPPGLMLMRTCTKVFTFPSPKGEGKGPNLIVEEDTPIMIPVYGLHYDSKYFKEPQEFNPGRFRGENKEFLNKIVYLPFGDGPRNCPGQRFGMLQIKVAIMFIIANFSVEINDKTMLPLEIDPKCLIPQAKGGIWLNLIRADRNLNNY